MVSSGNPGTTPTSDAVYGSCSLKSATTIHPTASGPAVHPALELWRTRSRLGRLASGSRIEPPGLDLITIPLSSPFPCCHAVDMHKPLNSYVFFFNIRPIFCSISARPPALSLSLSPSGHHQLATLWRQTGDVSSLNLHLWVPAFRLLLTLL